MKMYADGKLVGDVLSIKAPALDELSLEAILLDVWDSGSLWPSELLVQPSMHRIVRRLLRPKWKARRTPKMRRQRRRQSRLSWGL